MDIMLDQALKKLRNENILPGQVTKIGEGAWHRVYKLEDLRDEEFVLRIKKKEAYGEVQDFDSDELCSEYESTRSYYQHANESCSNVCPSFFQYFIEEDLVFTLETFMGIGQDLSLLTNKDAISYGKRLGYFFKKIHNKSPVIKGFGNLYWNGETLQGNNHQSINELWEEDNDHYIKILYVLNHSKLDFNKENVTENVNDLIKCRRKQIQEVSLVNQDITPENIILNTGKISIIDPFPKLDFGLKYAAYFVFCYKFLLPSFSNAPRYINNAYSEKSGILNDIAEGYIKGYFHDMSLDEYTNQVKRLMDEYTLWMLQEAYEHYEVLHEEKLTNKIIQQMGPREVIDERLNLIIRELETLCSRRY
ncbi:hypothetical protein GMD78_19885 [Ornithinibacillus sp. L9]|uniref:Aminoglycoside phosphotransferase domain-containing protein n=1 Tax=Ornithinibacillus caprae TaxID=2678566 RepID=A0A6N8FLW6_9BACI|nr:hypothetical protein [Ornithinibacillus caprae]MUK90622.1 hypothetical protein [Ornithinibacillus caprae]